MVIRRTAPEVAEATIDFWFSVRWTLPNLHRHAHGRNLGVMPVLKQPSGAIHGKTTATPRKVALP
jgi:hypothetical protein